MRTNRNAILGWICLISSTLLYVPCAHAQNPRLVPVLQGLLQKYTPCIKEKYETKLSSQAVGPLRDEATCVAGNKCTQASRNKDYDTLQAKANSGDPTDFETTLEGAILNDCFNCDKHHEWHTKQMHCTRECDGNQSYASLDPKSAGIGPCFEGCKAGVDITRLVNDIISDIRGALQSAGIGSGNEDHGAAGGPSVATNRTFVDLNDSNDPETCSPESLNPGPAGYYIAPPELLDWTRTSAPPFKQALTNYDPPSAPTQNEYDLKNLLNIGANEGRLSHHLREVAQRADPAYSLCKSAVSYALHNPTDGKAFADLSVTGRKSFEAFRKNPPQEAQILACVQHSTGTQAVSETKLREAVKEALDRAYGVALILREGGWPGANAVKRQQFGYIAVSGEDDQPHRPVNVPSAPFPQYDLDVNVPASGPSPGITLHTRYMIAHTFPPAASDHITATEAKGLEHDRKKLDKNAEVTKMPRTMPADLKPVLARDAEVILYIHGMDSRLEEALDLTTALHKVGREQKKNFTVISVDLPTSGYAEKLDPNQIAPLDFDGKATAGDVLGFAAKRYNVPVVDFIENFIVAFMNKLDKSIPVTSHLRAIVGGSLGGNMSFRLGRPRADAPWIKTVIPWSPAAIWPSFADDDTKHPALAVPWYLAGGDPEYLKETPGARRSFFYGGFDWQSKAAFVIPLGGGKPQAQYWYRDGWKCKGPAMRFDRIDRYETYSHHFRLWHWRLGMEQLMFSQQIKAAGTKQPLYLSNTIRMLLLCGMEDKGGDLCQHTREVAAKMEMTPGKALFLSNTGHSIHNERPTYLAGQIVDFIEAAPTASTSGVISGHDTAKESLLKTTITVTVNRIGMKPGTSLHPADSHLYARVQILDHTYLKSSGDHRTFSKTVSGPTSKVPIQIEAWQESSKAKGDSTQLQGRTEMIPRSAVRTLLVVFDPKTQDFTVSDQADSEQSKFKMKVPPRHGKAGEEFVFPANGETAPEMAFTITSRPG